MAKKTTETAEATPAKAAPTKAKARYWEPEPGEPERIVWMGKAEDMPPFVNMAGVGRIDITHEALGAGQATPHARLIQEHVKGFKLKIGGTPPVEG